MGVNPNSREQVEFVVAAESNLFTSEEFLYKEVEESAGLPDSRSSPDQKNYVADVFWFVRVVRSCDGVIQPAL